jgi:hypothetical protein
MLWHKAPVLIALVGCSLLTGCGDRAELGSVRASEARGCFEDAGAVIARSSEELKSFALDALAGDASNPKQAFGPDYNLDIWQPNEEAGAKAQPRYVLYVFQPSEANASIQEVADQDVRDGFVAYIHPFDAPRIARSDRCVKKLSRAPR